MTDSITWHRYDVDKARAILGGAGIRIAVTAAGTAVGVVLMVYGLVNIRQLGLFFLGLLFFVCFGIFLLVFRYAAVNSRQSFGRLTGNLVGISAHGIALEAITLPWDGIARIAVVNRQGEVAIASTPARNYGSNRLANALALSAGNGEVMVSIIVTDGAAAKGALAPRDRSFIGVQTKSTLPGPSPGMLVFTPDIVMGPGEVELLRMALRSGAESHGIEFYETDSTTDFTTKNFAAMGVDLS